MDNSCDASYWKPANRQQLRLIRAWEEEDLKLQLQEGLLLILVITVFYFYATLISLGVKSLQALIILYILALAGGLVLWGLILYEDQKELWTGRFYVRTVTCIGHTEISTRYKTGIYLDILGEAGEILEQIQVSSCILKTVRHQDKLLAFTRTPENLTPVRLVPLHLPGRK